jgi:hypothetical protein
VSEWQGCGDGGGVCVGGGGRVLETASRQHTPNTKFVMAPMDGSACASCTTVGAAWKCNQRENKRVSTIHLQLSLPNRSDTRKWVRVYLIILINFEIQHHAELDRLTTHQCESSRSPLAAKEQYHTVL